MCVGVFAYLGLCSFIMCRFIYSIKIQNNSINTSILHADHLSPHPPLPSPLLFPEVLICSPFPKFCHLKHVMQIEITADGDSSHEIKRRLLLGRKVMTNLDSIFKSKDIILPTKVRLVKAMVFPVVMYGCESWTVKKAKRRRIDAFELWCWRRLLRVPWTARRSNQSILKEISPGISLEGMRQKLKLQYFVHLTRRADSLEKTLMLVGLGAGGEGDGRG